MSDHKPVRALMCIDVGTEKWTVPAIMAPIASTGKPTMTSIREKHTRNAHGDEDRDHNIDVVVPSTRDRADAKTVRPFPPPAFKSGVTTVQRRCALQCTLK